jgi:hypothetical protein
MRKRANRPLCPKHKIPLVLRKNVKSGEVSLACIQCDVEAHGGGQSDIDLVRTVMEKTPDEAN